MMKSIYIIGAGGMGIETYSIFEANGLSDCVKGFLEENCTREGEMILDKYVYDINYILENKRLSESDAICAIGSTKRERLITELRRKDVKFISIIHPNSVVSTHSSIEKGTIISPFVVINPLVTVRSHKNNGNVIYRYY